MITVTNLRRSPTDVLSVANDRRQTPTTTYTDVPKSAEGLRATLAKVSLQDWLPSLLCPPLERNPDDVTDRKACRGAVEEALATQPFAEVTLVHDHQAAVIR